MHTKRRTAKIEPSERWRYDEYGNRKNPRGLSLKAWIEPDNHRVWIDRETREPAKDGVYVVKWIDGTCGRVKYIKRAAYWETGMRVTHWSRDISGAPEN